MEFVFLGPAHDFGHRYMEVVPVKIKFVDKPRPCCRKGGLGGNGPSTRGQTGKIIAVRSGGFGNHCYLVEMDNPKMGWIENNKAYLYVCRESVRFRLCPMSHGNTGS